MKTKIKIFAYILFVICIFSTSIVYADVQAREGTNILFSSSDNMAKSIRNMELPSSSLGLNATFGIEDGKYVETSASNNIDVHLSKATEYGAVITLVKSQYGSNMQETQTSNKTNTYSTVFSTTCNITGVYGMKITCLYGPNCQGIITAANKDESSNFPSLKTRYVNNYSNNLSKPGDYTTEYGFTIPDNTNYCRIYDGRWWYASSKYGDSAYAVIVNGQGV